MLLRTVLDPVTGDLSDTRTRYLGSRPVKLFRVRMQGQEAVSGASSPRGADPVPRPASPLPLLVGRAGGPPGRDPLGEGGKQNDFVTELPGSQLAPSTNTFVPVTILHTLGN